jgi:glycosyltransferase involved in cell wall biosynthesis
MALHRQFLDAGVESRLCATFNQAPQSGAKATLEFRRIGPEVLYYSPLLKRRAEELVNEADVVHGHGLYVGTNYAFGQAARNIGKSLVYHVHGMFEPYILRRSRWKKRLVHWLFEDANFRQVRLWRALTQKEADQIRAVGITAPIVVAPNGLDLLEFEKPAQLSQFIRTPLVEKLPKDKLRLLFIGRLHPKKGLDMLLWAWAQLYPQHKQWELVLAGPDEGEYGARLRQMAGGLGIDSVTHFTGPVTGDVKKALLYSAELFVLPSYSEGFSMSLLEAMACELPVIATHACNFPEISLKEAGWECHPCRSCVLAVLERALNADSTERHQRGANARRLVQNNYAWPAVVTRLVEACRAHC